MSFNDILKNSFLNSWETQQNMANSTMLHTFFIVCVLSIYILMVYRHTTKSSFYSINFAKTLTGVPIITTSIVFAMQVNLLVSLGMVGALSVIRFRTAIKDPLDLLFLFWGISIGIVCGTGSYILSIFLSVIMTMILFLVEIMPNKVDCLLLVINTESNVKDDTILNLVKLNTNYNKIRTLATKKESKDFLIEIKIKKNHNLVDKISNVEGVNKVVLLSHDGEVRL